MDVTLPRDRLAGPMHEDQDCMFHGGLPSSDVPLSVPFLSQKHENMIEERRQTNSKGHLGDPLHEDRGLGGNQVVLVSQPLFSICPDFIGTMGKRWNSKPKST